MYILGLVEAALELIPEAIVQHPTVVAAAKARGKPARHTLLDEADHASALKNLPSHIKRGRPDIVHHSLLTAFDSVLARANRLQVFVQTHIGTVIQIESKIRLPRRFTRFTGLMEQLLVKKQVPINTQPLMKLYPGDLTSYVKTLSPSQIITFTPKGTPTSPVTLAQQLVEEPNPLLLVGGFAHGELSPSILDFADQRIALDPEFLPAATIIGMIIHAIEGALNLTDQRFKQD